MEYKLKVYDIWEFGQRVDKAGKPHQEDSLYPEFGKAAESDRLFIICDGMGGHDAGEVASATVCEEMSRSVNAALQGGEEFSRATFDAALDAAFKGLDRKDVNPESKKKMGTTMTFLKLSRSGAFVGHMGDSRVYHIRPGKDGSSTRIVHKTYDHSLVNDLVRIGELTEEEARRSPRRNVITRAMQPHLDRRPRADVYSTADVRPGDYFYMCTDGMLESMEDDRIRDIFSEDGGDDSRKMETLKRETEANQDNHTAFVVHITDVIAEPGDEPVETAEPVADGERNAPEAMPAPPAAIERNAPLTAGMARKREARTSRARWLLLAVVALLAIALVLLFFASRK